MPRASIPRDSRTQIPPPLHHLSSPTAHLLSFFFQLRERKRAAESADPSSRRSRSPLGSGSPLLCANGERSVWDGGGRRVQAQVPGAQGQEDPPLHHLQDRREEEDGRRRQGRRARAQLRRLRCQPPCERVQVRDIRLRLRDRGELPEEQDILHRVVS